ncbi:hypothetical protein [Sphingobium yanoikuyae]|uniref:hypothetical protein n=1 Tax=Sphingobium yanoikuyae TaxID=13690 RepID=UPI0035AEDC1B
MAWTPFSGEAVELHCQLDRLNRAGRISDAIDVIKAALEKAYRDGPSNENYKDFEARIEREPAADSA